MVHRPTQADVAKVAGVSQATVSMVLSGSSNPNFRVSEPSRRRVLAAVDRLGYVANPLAQRLAGGRSRIIGVFTYEATFPVDSMDFYQPFLVGIEETAQELSLDLLLFTSTPSAAGRKRLADVGWNRVTVADGCILIGKLGDDDELLRLSERRYPFVYVGRREAGSVQVPYVGVDYVTATSDLTTTLVSLGHRHIALYGDLGPSVSARDRVAGYRAAMTAHGLRPLLVDNSALSYSEFLDQVADHQVTAVLLGHDVSPMRFDLACRARGLTIPDDLSVMLLGESADQRATTRAWSGFATPRLEMGAQALRLLAHIISGATTGIDRSQLLPCRPTAGETAGSPREPSA